MVIPMKPALPNPFNITKADDLSDQEINTYWVDLPKGGGFEQIAKPTSRMPILILGGKGSGKTHLMRHFSYQLQKLRLHEGNIDSIQAQGYLGIYLRCGGLNAARFAGKGQDREKWAAVFSYYMDLWIGQLVMTTILDVLASAPLSNKLETEIVKSIARAFSDNSVSACSTFNELLESFQRFQKTVDLEVNNSALTRRLNVNIPIPPGDLVHTIPHAIFTKIPALKNVQCLYLIDELENLSEDQQRYVQTLLRERKKPVSFKIGSRLHGIRTLKTLSAEEENKEGSEFEVLHLDAQMRAQRGYGSFSRLLVLRRLREAEYEVKASSNGSETKAIDDSFETFSVLPFAAGEIGFVKKRDGHTERPHLAALRNHLLRVAGTALGKGVANEKTIDAIIALIRVPEYPLLEKNNLLLLYQDWHSGADLHSSARQIAAGCKSHLVNPRRKSRFSTTLSHFQGDLLAQLARSYEQRQRYVGIETFIAMSHGLPRNLLIILKHIFKWAAFNGEHPFVEGKISIQSQLEGVREASDWFFNDAFVSDGYGVLVRDSIARLAALFREIRFSDKPSECSLATFSADLSRASSEARHAIELAEKASLLIDIRRGQRDRNSGRVDRKLQLNSMLAPRWDLPVHRRGAIALNPDEINSIFDPSHVDRFDELKRIRVERMTAPLFGKKVNGKARDEQSQPHLPGFTG
jgi:hypothetical protein